MAGVSTPTVSRFENGEEDIQLSSVKKILGALGMINKNEKLLTFPDELEFGTPPRIAGVVFWGQDAQQNHIRCRITEEAVDDYFGSKGLTSKADRIKICQKNKGVITYIARRKFLLNQLEDGDVVIQFQDF